MLYEANNNMSIFLFKICVYISSLNKQIRKMDINSENK